jgi:hypothetical protein
VNEKRWQPGDIVVLRYIETETSARMVHAYIGDPAGPADEPFLVSGEVVTVQARPYRVIEDTEEAVALYQPSGAPMPRWRLRDRRYVENPTSTRGDSVRLLFPGRHYDVTLFFETSDTPPWFYSALFDGDGLTAGWRERERARAPRGYGRSDVPHRRFRGWYVNIQTPPVRTAVGFDIADLALDIVIRPDRSWYWKDEDELATAVSRGACSSQFAAALRVVGENVVPLIEEGAWPFNDEWIAWPPPSDWRIDSVPDGWQELPGLLKDDALGNP